MWGGRGRNASSGTNISGTSHQLCEADHDAAVGLQAGQGTSAL